jgi:hypothetical protein
MVMKRLSKSARKIRNEFLKTIVTMIGAGFALVAALAWNTAITEIIKKYLKPGSTISSWLIYALIVTFIAALVGLYLGILSGQIRRSEEEIEKQEKE